MPAAPAARTAEPAGTVVAGALLGFVALCWGTSFLWIDLATDGSAPPTIVVIRCLTGALVGLAALALSSPEVRRQHRPAALRPWLRQGAVAAVLIAAIPFMSMALALRQIDTGTAAIVNATTPCWGALIAFFLLRRAGRPGLSPRLLAGLLVGILGVAVVVGGLSAAALGGVALILLLAVSNAAGGHYVESTFAAAPPQAAILFAMGLTGVVLLPLGIAGAIVHPPTATALATAAIAGVVTNGVGYVAYFVLLRRAGAVRSLTVVYLIPIVAIAIGATVLDEPFGLRQVAGLVLVMLGVLAVLTARDRAAPSGAAPEA